VERFEGYIAGMELCNAFTELNDPLDQEQRFIEMARDYAPESEDAQPLDEDYLRAMRTACRPTAALAWASTASPCSSPIRARSGR
jgi:lysyl-tRNA synthetase class 2